MAKPTTGRAGVAPALECCPICGHRADLHATRDGDRLCYLCYADYEACCDREAEEMLHCKEQATKAAAPAQGVPDALLPWLRGVVDYARRQ